MLCRVLRTFIGSSFRSELRCGKRGRFFTIAYEGPMWTRTHFEWLVDGIGLPLGPKYAVTRPHGPKMSVACARRLSGAEHSNPLKCAFGAGWSRPSWTI